MSSWLPEFDGPRKEIDYENENIPYLKRQERIGKDDDWKEVFLVDPDDNDSFQFPVEQCKNFLDGTTGISIRPDDAEDGSTPYYNAWLDDRSREGGARVYRNPFTAEELKKKLLKSRYRPKTPGTWAQVFKAVVRANASALDRSVAANHASDLETMNTNTVVRASTGASFATCLQPVGETIPNVRHLARTWRVGLRWGSTLDNEPDAARRLLFITDLDSETATVLMQTASNHQTRPLRHALLDHITSNDAHISVKVPSKSPSTFELAFNIPFYAWRDTYREDHRKWAHSRQPLRETVDVSFLNQHHGEVLCKAVLTAMISGSDIEHWTAYLFADTYFDAQDAGRETVLEYRKDKESEEGMNADPLTYGEIDADLPFWDPRKYFLIMARYRLQQVAKEWTQVVARFGTSFADFQKSHGGFLSQPTHCRDHRDQLQRNYDWVMRTNGISKDLEETLAATVDAIAAMLKHAAFFGEETGLLSEIEALFDLFKRQQKKIERLCVKCKALSQKVRQASLAVRETTCGLTHC
ncbi:hypothetical protein Z517_04744 [Fonsecaea pedrosoi CBS 271.37]|uniref:Unplaced genomic scaffold supercont1.3, whole genome shotgun sequence n=1 Tax=Fonsecaea pedrosoi CBS 271.37 TaxID=1442368 RepID=A0A0D2GLA4_9EURO|nr:uncharacterized protein Z517_04744 [Fonsecaea pedrosoi CBS 271.37]KIW81718.1 hypothetical protein Z517_04744 [Fonsecaea pedrosoi CBS 271.37]